MCIKCGEEILGKVIKKMCTKCYDKNRREENPEKFKIKNKKWYKENLEKSKASSKKWYKENPERARALNKKWRKENPERAKVLSRKWKKENPEKVKIYSKNSYKKNLEKIKIYSKRWQEKNQDKIRIARKDRYKKETEKAKAYTKKWREENPEKFKQYQNKPNVNMSKRLRQRLRGALKIYTKEGKIMSSNKYGLDIKAIYEYLGPCPGEKNLYHIDHIRPLCSFNFFNKDGTQNLEEIKKANAPENHQWLLAKENLSKGGKYNGT